MVNIRRGQKFKKHKIVLRWGSTLEHQLYHRGASSVEHCLPHSRMLDWRVSSRDATPRPVGGSGHREARTKSRRKALTSTTQFGRIYRIPPLSPVFFSCRGDETPASRLAAPRDHICVGWLNCRVAAPNCDESAFLLTQ